MKGPAVCVDGGWRLPAAEIERSIAATAQSILDDQQTVVSAIEEVAFDSSRIAPFLKSSAAWSERLQVEQDNALSSLIDRVDLGQDGMRLSIRLPLSNTGAADLAKPISRCSGRWREHTAGSRIS
jgi:hypothetical protein